MAGRAPTSGEAPGPKHPAPPGFLIGASKELGLAGKKSAFQVRLYLIQFRWILVGQLVVQVGSCETCWLSAVLRDQLCQRNGPLGQHRNGQFPQP